MGFKDIQAFIPGWNIVYMIREYVKDNQEIARKEQEIKNLQAQGQQDLKTARFYAQLRDRVKAAGDFDTSERLDEQITGIALSYLKRIN